ncbi:ImmA/IrrE family metallo-endopeptidase [Kitasatospora purpeofusca]|uniref:ImmA/IrrE family metallo-endopeptidase n=1 Tax=Kitasatospora purpeofusca TaxID=67352 RepID=UPI00224DDE61|nr:ImmA/IrrE family metallo-endopeptidase [Kitasatospora purpeofusca]MCX4758595.1 ImmA/IrrE family metallo-endopeptidase [Kitasatospora purpeofusca]WSR30964.1 ImmA/IrrE family metallo-endopeptidase [Kitasatospora purpeofusca]
MVDYVLAGAARTQASAMVEELEAARPGAVDRLGQGALAELRSWPELIVVSVEESTAEQGCSVAGAYDFGPPPRLSVATSASHGRRDFTALHELGHHLQKNSFALMDAFSREPDGGVLLEDAACDAFAAEILLPASLVDRHLDATGPDASAVAQLWRASNASRMAVCVRAAQRLPAPGHVLLLDTAGRLVFGASHGLPPLRRGSRQGDIPVIDRALAGSGRAQGRTRVRYRDGILGRELHADVTAMDGYLVAVLVADSAAWRAFTPPTLDTGPQSREYICASCDEEYSSFESSCPRCRIPRCPECSRCACPPRVAERRCPGCFTLHPPAMFPPGSDRCLDCA